MKVADIHGKTKIIILRGVMEVVSIGIFVMVKNIC